MKAITIQQAISILMDVPHWYDMKPGERYAAAFHLYSADRAAYYYVRVYGKGC